MQNNIFKFTLIEKVRRTDKVLSFRFAADRSFVFCPGQFVQVIFDEKNLQNKDLNKYLSISCAPGKEYVELTKKITESDFSKKLSAVDKGGQIAMKGPMGSCVFDGGEGKIGFIIGGIGITPVVSILENIDNKKLPTDAVLLYANWKEQDIAFKDELDSIQNQNSNIKIVHVLAEEEKQGFKKGLIDKAFIKENIPDYAQRVIYIFGPPKMVDELKNHCLGIGVEPAKVKIENFLGY